MLKLVQDKVVPDNARIAGLAYVVTLYKVSARAGYYII